MYAQSIILFIVVAVLYVTATLVDEFHFHRNRGLHRQEVIGYPINTLTVIACFLFLALAERNLATEKIYYLLAILSCLSITKDEWIHRKACSGGEMWMHSVLYILHPLLLFIAMLGWEDHRATFLAFAGGATIYLFYQVTYWNLIEVHRRRVKTQKHYAGAPQDELYDYFGE